LTDFVTFCSGDAGLHAGDCRSPRLSPAW